MLPRLFENERDGKSLPFDMTVKKYAGNGGAPLLFPPSFSFGLTERPCLAHPRWYRCQNPLYQVLFIAELASHPRQVQQQFAGIFVSTLENENEGRPPELQNLPSWSQSTGKFPRNFGRDVVAMKEFTCPPGI
jgi:hypothetical protein